jgi:integrase
MQGHIRKRTYTTKAGKETVNWYVVVDLGRDANAKRRQKWHGGYRTRKEAEVARTKIVGDLHAGTYTEPTKLTLREWVEDKWLPTVRTQVKPSTFDSYQRNIHLHVLPTLGGRSLVDIGPGQLNTLYVDLLEHGRRNGPGGLSPKTVHYIHTMVHKALADAVDAGLIAANAAARAKPPRPRSAAPKELLFWTPEQLRSFLDLVAGQRLEAAWNVSAMTGMRRGEVLGLRWADLDLTSSRIHVRQALVSVAYKLIVSTPKNHLARVIDLDPATVEQIRRHRQRQLAEQEEWGTTTRMETLSSARRTVSRSTRRPFRKRSNGSSTRSTFLEFTSTASATPTPRSRCELAFRRRSSANASATKALRSRSSSTPTSSPACKPTPRSP